eukprot:228808_1
MISVLHDDIKTDRSEKHDIESPNATNAEQNDKQHENVMHIDDERETKNRKDVRNPLDIQNHQLNLTQSSDTKTLRNDELNPQLQMNTHRQRRNWRRSLMNTKVKQTVYEDPDADEVKEKTTKEPQEEDMKEPTNKKDEEPSIDYEYDEQYTTQFTMKWCNITHAIKQELYTIFNYYFTLTTLKKTTHTPH